MIRLISDTQLAESMIRLVQEALTNYLKHSSASEISIRLQQLQQQITLIIADNGGNAKLSRHQQIKEGNGLIGMRERVEKHQGHINFRYQQGFTIEANTLRRGERIMSIRALLVDDQTLVRSGIRSLLELSEDISVCAEASDGVEGISMMQQHQPDIVLMDIRMPVLNGIETIKKMQQLQIKIPTIVLTTFDDNELFLAAIKQGAKGFLLKDVSLEQLTTAVRTVAAGGSLIQPVMTERVIKGYQNFKEHTAAVPGELPEKLSQREVEILRLMAGGFSNKEISSAIFKSEGTIKNHVSSILSKLAVRDRTRAVLKAIELGLI